MFVNALRYLLYYYVRRPTGQINTIDGWKFGLDHRLDDFKGRPMEADLPIWSLLLSDHWLIKVSFTHESMNCNWTEHTHTVKNLHTSEWRCQLQTTITTSLTHCAHWGNLLIHLPTYIIHRGLCIIYSKVFTDPELYSCTEEIFTISICHTWLHSEPKPSCCASDTQRVYIFYISELSRNPPGKKKTFYSTETKSQMKRSDIKK